MAASSRINSRGGVRIHGDRVDRRGGDAVVRGRPGVASAQQLIDPSACGVQRAGAGVESAARIEGQCVHLVESSRQVRGGPTRTRTANGTLHQNLWPAI